jgi:hypothetical protein
MIFARRSKIMGIFESLFGLKSGSAAKEFEFPARDGDGRCSDKSCPCPEPGTLIPHGEGYLYISAEAAKFRSDCLSWKEFLAKMERFGQRFGGNVHFMLHDQSVINPVLMCEEGARKRNLNLEVAAADAKHWWSTGQVLMRPTPKMK